MPQNRKTIIENSQSAIAPRITSFDLSPAGWLWLPGERTLPNTAVVFRRQLSITGRLESAVGWIFADSRYRLLVNGERVQWGPAPADPRWPEIDPLDLTTQLVAGRSRPH